MQNRMTMLAAACACVALPLIGAPCAPDVTDPLRTEQVAGVTSPSATSSASSMSGEVTVGSNPLERPALLIVVGQFRTPGEEATTDTVRMSSVPESRTHGTRKTDHEGALEAWPFLLALLVAVCTAAFLWRHRFGPIWPSCRSLLARPVWPRFPWRRRRWSLACESLLRGGADGPRKNGVQDAPARLPARPRELFNCLQEFAAAGELDKMPERPGRKWDAGLATTKGRVRRENQDAGMAWRQGDLQIAVVADGVGGLPHGHKAAWAAASAAAMALASCAGNGQLERDASACLRAVFRYAANALFEQARTCGLLGKDCLRTTLIVAVCTAREYLWGFIGDGGIVLRRADGTLERLMVPHKAEGMAPNVLAASLGPRPDGQAFFGRTDRRAGDLLFVGSDGVFDRVEPPFFGDLADAARNTYGGDLQALADDVLEQLGAARDQFGYVCDDNMTLALVATGDPGEYEQDCAEPAGCAAGDVSPGNEQP